MLLIVRPPLFLRLFSSSQETNTATWRVQMRGVGIYFFLFALQPILAELPNSKFWEAVRHDLVLAFGIAPILIAVVLWIVWKFSLRGFIRYAQIEGINEDPRWERKMTLLFASLLLAIIALAFIFAALQAL